MNKKYFIGIAVVVLAILGVMFFGNRSAVAPGAPEGSTTEVGTTTTEYVPGAVSSIKKTATPSAATMTKSGAYIVSYTTSGFNPVAITLKRGKSVHFVNNSNKAMRISAVDQNSQVFHELSQEQSVGRGGTYDFTFLTAGNWYYMNRNNSADRGTIVVE
jgi:plastocyanin